VITDGHKGTGSEGETIACVGSGQVFDPASLLLEAVDVLVFHEPPAGSDTACMAGIDYGSIELADFLAATSRPPRVILAGHIHRPRKRIVTWGRTMIINPGTCDVATKRPFASIKFHPGEVHPVISLV
jgi:Icc-related predicted phosphoesterase